MFASPLEPILGHLTAELPRSFRQQFFTAPEAHMMALVSGMMHEIWYPRWLAPLFWMLGKAHILVPTAGHSIPTVLQVIPGRDTDGSPKQEWNRTFNVDANTVHHFDTTVIFDSNLNRVMDRVGPGKRIYLVWDVKFVPPDTLSIQRERCGIGFGQRRVWLPRWLGSLLLGRERFTQTADSERDDTIHIELIIGHPVFGDIFIYRGTFQVSLQPSN